MNPTAPDPSGKPPREMPTCDYRSSSPEAPAALFASDGDDAAAAHDEALGVQLDKHLETLQRHTTVPPAEQAPHPEVAELTPVVEQLKQLADYLAAPTAAERQSSTTHIHDTSAVGISTRSAVNKLAAGAASGPPTRGQM